VIDLALFDAVAAALGTPEIGRALEETLALTARALALDAAWIWLRDDVTGRFYLAASHDLPPWLREPVHMTGDTCWCMEALLDGDFVSRNVDVIACSRLRDGMRAAGEPATGGIHAHASVALRFAGRDLGLMNASRVRGVLSEDELRVLSTVGAQIGLAVERARLAEAAATSARAEERARMAREMHDVTAQDLAAIALQLDAGRVAPARALASEALERVRAIVGELRGDALAGRPLPAALAALARRVSSETGLRIVLHAADLPALSAVTERELYRIAAEALANASRHANATRVEIVLAVRDEAIVLQVVDDGDGFDPAEPNARYGLVGMRERAEALGGELTIRSAPAHGTTLDVHLPRSAA
jgi:two-component system NarL family sensor kinase